MKVQNIFVKELSRQVEIVVCENKKELDQKLSILTSTLSELAYQSWVLETFIVGVNILFSAISEESSDSQQVKKIKDVLYHRVLELNPDLAPSKLYINLGNTVQLGKTPIKLTENSNWKTKEDPSNLMVINFQDYFSFQDNAREIEHYIEIEPWELTNFSVAIRRFNKRDKAALCLGCEPKTEDDVKFFVTASCVDNFHQLHQYIQNDPELGSIPLHKIIYSLYDLCIQHNPFLKLKAKDFKKINKSMCLHKAGSAEQVVPNKVGRKSLTSVPKKEIINLEELIGQEIFGLAEPIKAVSNCIRKAYLGLKNPKTPIGAFLFYGPTSVGKTELAKVIARILTKSDFGLVKIPCNTLISSHNLHTLIGSPPGYVGYEEKGLLSRAFESGKFKILLFDEVEKASWRIFDFVLQVLEEGQILTADGTVLDLTDCLILFTSNIGQQDASKAVQFGGFISDKLSEKEKILEATFREKFEKEMRPEFLARLNGTFYFKPLTEEELGKIAHKFLNQYVERLKSKGAHIKVPKNAEALILSYCRLNKKSIHARDIRNYIELEVFDQIGDQYIALSPSKDEVVNIELKPGAAGFQIKASKVPQKQKLAFRKKDC